MPVAETYHIATLIAADSTATHGLCREADAPWSEADRAISHTVRADYVDGIAPTPRRELPGYNSGLMAIVIGVFLIIAVNMRHYTTFLKTFTQNLFSVRKRTNMFDDRSTTNEARVLISLIVLLCLSEGILMFTALRRHGIEIDNLAGVVLMTIVAAAYYVFQIAAYSTVGYVFTTPRRAITWMKGFNASQTLLGIALAAPALIALFYPSRSGVLLGISIGLYVTARLIFIYKGFRIFYNNFLALIYFILYLCSLEIIPLIIIYKATTYLAALL